MYIGAESVEIRALLWRKRKKKKNRYLEKITHLRASNVGHTVLVGMHDMIQEIDSRYLATSPWTHVYNQDDCAF